MKLASLHWIAYTALALNVALVLTTGLSAHFAQSKAYDASPTSTSSATGELEESATGQENGEQSLPTELPLPTPTRVAETPSDKEAGVATPLESELPGVPSLEVPSLELPSTELPSVPSPEVPSLEQVPPEVENDPVYQEIKKMFSEKGGMLETPPMLETLIPAVPQTGSANGNSTPVPSREYFTRLESRMAAAIRLCESARDVAIQAADAAEQGNASQAAEFLKMATQLREMAANIISQPL